ncbi:unnamed protein product, partial [Closterium sp. Naga37s-1]
LTLSRLLTEEEAFGLGVESEEGAPSFPVVEAQQGVKVGVKESSGCCNLTRSESNCSSHSARLIVLSRDTDTTSSTSSSLLSDFSSSAVSNVTKFMGAEMGIGRGFCSSGRGWTVEAKGVGELVEKDVLSNQLFADGMEGEKSYNDFISAGKGSAQGSSEACAAVGSGGACTPPKTSNRKTLFHNSLVSPFPCLAIPLSRHSLVSPFPCLAIHLSRHSLVSSFPCLAIPFSPHSLVSPFDCLAIPLSRHSLVSPFPCLAIPLSRHFLVSPFPCLAIPLSRHFLSRNLTPVFALLHPHLTLCQRLSLLSCPTQQLSLYILFPSSISSIPCVSCPLPSPLLPSALLTSPLLSFLHPHRPCSPHALSFHALPPSFSSHLPSSPTPPQVMKRASERVFVPLTVGGGIRDITSSPSFISQSFISPTSPCNRPQVMKRASERVFVPLTVGGGIRDFTDANGRLGTHARGAAADGS